MVSKILKKINGHIKARFIPKRLLLPTVTPDQAEIDAVLKELEIEREWHSATPSFQNIQEIGQALKDGRLAKVGPTADYLPILRLRNAKLADTYPPYLSQEAKALLDEIGTLWRKAMNARGFDEKIRLAVTSLVRTVPYQNEIVAAGKLADPESVHTKGEAFDIDAAGYYLDGTPVNARKDLHKSFHKAFEQLDAGIKNPEYADYSLYNPEVHTLLGSVLSEMLDQGKLHYVLEHPGTSNAVFHICRNSAYIPSKVK